MSANITKWQVQMNDGGFLAELGVVGGNARAPVSCEQPPKGASMAHSHMHSLMNLINILLNMQHRWLAKLPPGSKNS